VSPDGIQGTGHDAVSPDGIQGSGHASIPALISAANALTSKA
jgi:hypothetical protein